MLLLCQLGVSKPEIDAILEDCRKMYMEDNNAINDDTFDFLASFSRRLPPSVVEQEEERAATEEGVAPSTSFGFKDEQGAKQEEEDTFFYRAQNDPSGPEVDGGAHASTSSSERPAGDFVLPPDTIALAPQVDADERA